MTTYQLRSSSSDGHRVSLDCPSWEEVNRLWLLLSDNPFAPECSDGSAGTSRWRLDESGTIIVGINRVAVEVGINRIAGEYTGRGGFTRAKEGK